MKLIKIIFVLLFTLSLLSFSTCDSVKKNNEKDNIVLIKTTYGEIKIKLYEETPLHKENFLKLINEKFYDSTLFHRVILDFMIQGGDPESKNAQLGQNLGNGGPGYTIEAEFLSKYIHKRGAVAAARMPDNVNPEKKSSGSQFYIVQGKVFTGQELDKIEKNVNTTEKRKFFMSFIERAENLELKNEIDSLQKNKDMDALQKLSLELEHIIDSSYTINNELFKFTDEQRNIYTSIGGTPHLDKGYTVFGEVIEGMDIVDSIAKCKRNKMDRPIEDIRITISTVKK